MQIENSATRDNCSASFGKFRDAEELPSWQYFQYEPHSKIFVKEMRFIFFLDVWSRVYEQLDSKQNCFSNTRKGCYSGTRFNKTKRRNVYKIVFGKNKSG